MLLRRKSQSKKGSGKLKRDDEFPRRKFGLLAGQSKSSLLFTADRKLAEKEEGAKTLTRRGLLVLSPCTNSLSFLHYKKDSVRKRAGEEPVENRCGL